jgi:CheY-like chemotaxis protein
MKLLKGFKAMGKNRGNGFTVMIVEDLPDIRYITKMLLRVKGCWVVEAVDAEEAIKVALRERPDLILMDMHLPHTNGIDATRRLRTFAELKDVPIVALSAYDRSLFEPPALDAGCNEYVTKPLDFDKLDALLARYLPAPTHQP